MKACKATIEPAVLDELIDTASDLGTSDTAITSVSVAEADDCRFTRGVNSVLLGHEEWIGTHNLLAEVLGSF